MALKFYKIVEKGLKLKVRKFWGLALRFVKVTTEKLIEGVFVPTPILNRVNPCFLTSLAESKSALTAPKIQKQ